MKGGEAHGGVGVGCPGVGIGGGLAGLGLLPQVVGELRVLQQVRQVALLLLLLLLLAQVHVGGSVATPNSQPCNQNDAGSAQGFH